MRPESERARNLRRSEIRILFDAALRHAGAIRLEVGEPSFTTPNHVIDAAMKAARDGFTKYGPNGGLLSLRELLAAKIAKIDGFEVDPDQVVVTPGGMNALSSTFLALLDADDEVLIPTPGFPNLDQMVSLYGGVPVFYPLSADNGFLPDLAVLEQKVTARTKVLFVNTPSNPTGAVFPPGSVEDLVEFCQRHDLWMLSDEVYDELILEEGLEHTAAGRFDSDGRVVTVYSFSKVYAMTGWRVGYAVASPEMADSLRKLQEPQVSCPSTVSQKAAEAALTGPRRPFDQMLEAYRKRRGAALEAASAAGLRVVRPHGTLYMLIDISSWPRPGLDFALSLLEQRGVSVAPGSVFGPGGEGWIRISLAAEEADIVEGIGRIGAHLRDGA
ncbi:MAG TPA: aminotransferase class I/II-fold pyridoxal phosphate-dependent enzyme [Acidimicrobiia bacterium]|nr:aminotransferase class I/II-fold pyridoxal phosphate-dependent enzyme [Acidimicrobiia bacterium]